MIRVLAFQKVRHVVNDFWCMFDLLLVLFAVVETWVLWLLEAAFSLDAAGSRRLFVVIRTMRLMRILRIVKLFRFLPELLVIVRCIGVALHAISLVFTLLGTVLYMSAIAFRILLENTSLGRERFETVSQAMGTLLIECTLSGTKGGPLMREAYQVHPIYSFFVFCFVLIANVTMMGVLGGLLVQSVKKVAEFEEEERQITKNFAIMDDFWTQVDAMGNKSYIARDEFLDLFSKPQILKLLKKMEVDPAIVVSLSDFMFEENNGHLSREAFHQWVLDMRGTQKSTLKDHYVTRKFMKAKLKQIFEADPEAGKIVV